MMVPLTPAEEDKLLTKAREIKKSLLGIWAEYGPGPSEEEIDQNRAEMFSTFG
jgi:hypothetical protein